MRLTRILSRIFLYYEHVLSDKLLKNALKPVHQEVSRVKHNLTVRYLPKLIEITFRNDYFKRQKFKS